MDQDRRVKFTDDLPHLSIPEVDVLTPTKTVRHMSTNIIRSNGGLHTTRLHSNRIHVDDIHIRMDPKMLPTDNSERGRVMVIPWLTGVTLTILVSLFGYICYDVHTIIQKNAEYSMYGLYAFIPVSILFFSYAVSCSVNNIWTIFTSLDCLHKNSKTYSAIQTPLTSLSFPTPSSYVRKTPESSTRRSVTASFADMIRAASTTRFPTPRASIFAQIPSSHRLPPVIIQMPVYKESLKDVIEPSYRSLAAAAAKYSSYGGCCKILICDDGFQCVNDEERETRRKFYYDNGISMVARPPEGRVGIFKKASNLNYTYRISNENCAVPTDAIVIGRPYIPQNALILLVDADTRVPVNCIIDTVPEFIQSPELSYTQHLTTPFDIPDEDRYNLWLHMISLYTERIYALGIAQSTARGSACPLVGHNAFLRYSDLKEMGYWDEHSVSEDYSLFMSLATIGKFGRYVTYTGSEFQEGVSLNFSSEILKFQKFTYGACEMCFRPFREWLTKGILAPGISHMLTSRLPWFDKVNILIYMSSYFALAVSFYFTILETVSGFVFPELYNTYMQRGFNVMLSCMVLFGALATFSQIVFNFKVVKYENKRQVLRMIATEIGYIPFITLFFSSTMFHTTMVSLQYFLSMRVSWGATSKDKEAMTSRWRAGVRILRTYPFMYGFLGGLFVVYMCLRGNSTDLVKGWTIGYYCVTHMVSPFVFEMFRAF